jgi:3-hydroxyacyl-[acyl-carrier-protein] dehydratase
MPENFPGKLKPIESLLPHGKEFRFVDRIVHFEAGRRIEAELDLRPSEPYFAGHFPGRPLMPGVLITEALAQVGGLLLGLTHEVDQATENSPLPQFTLAAAQMKFTRPVAPGVTLGLSANLERDFGLMYLCRVEARVLGEIVASGNVTLATMEIK